MKVIRIIWGSAKSALKGEEKLWIVFWLWGIALYFGSILTGFSVFFIPEHMIGFMGPLTGWLGFILVYIYPIIFCFSLWRSSSNTSASWKKVAARIYAVVIFPFIHFHIGPLLVLASMSLIEENFKRLPV